MTAPEPDDDLRTRLRELGAEEAAHAPAFHAIRARRAAAEQPVAGAGFWLRPAWTIVLVAMVALGGGWRLMRDRGEPGEPPAVLVSDAEAIDATAVDFLIEEEWTTATDGLLADADGAAATPNIERLTQEIAALLQP